MVNLKKTLLVIGGGAAGFFGAINYAEKNPDDEVIILEKSNKLLSKVKISGGGRCNVTNSISNPIELSKFYPRGEKELIGPFNKFTTTDTIKWFENRGVKLKTEEDGRVFPITDDSQTIIDCFLNEAKKHTIKVLTKKNVEMINQSTAKNWKVSCSDKTEYEADNLLITTGSSEQIWNTLNQLGHEIIKPVPSLFTFNIKDERLKDIPGISVQNVEIKITDTNYKSSGPMLITHWGLSGPAILKLSAFAARELSSMNYNFEIEIDFIPKLSLSKLVSELKNVKLSSSKKIISTYPLFNIPLRLWERITAASGISSTLKWNDISNSSLNNLAKELAQAKFMLTGKSTFKEEFVTSGGVSLKEVDFKTMQSKILPNIYFAGEVLNIDALTGGFNFQSAWTTSWIAANSMK